MMDQIKSAIEPLRKRIMNSIARGVIQSITDTSRIQQGQVTLLAGETLDGIDRIQQYGFSSVPPQGAECVVLCLGGNRDHAIIISTDDRRSRPKGSSSGDTVLWTRSGAILALRDATQNIELTLNKLKISNGSNELISVLSELCAFLIDARTETPEGPQPLFDITGVDTLSGIKTKIDSFKE